MHDLLTFDATFDEADAIGVSRAGSERGRGPDATSAGAGPTPGRDGSEARS